MVRNGSGPVILTLDVGTSSIRSLAFSESGGILASPWFWVVVGALVVGGAVAGIVWATRDVQPVVGSPMVMALSR